ncbi:malto-oligosyltrehalose synthase [Dietzia maris]|jgi:(1->4)-alpha-D-glucan 1-alpha-D-glucosylmutase|uniref:Malto-oligosyltrehalose synthase n=1 Tax=Dietzia maris TaxID=37915 RepID=A0A365P8I5_9ACTN|nr:MULTISPECIES: malto-oligosyltrehalose synthase [Dietzia]MCZ4539740.1 malto-oligosyltrehalose synthase [Dietzia maris]MCZ4656833.1 malto-oligosyltrehalose synthase [Dietzia kunjamensis]MDV3355792.1 malto-oligosyltrehalose synthase [Dietzia sp. IN118]RBA33570.1 malto-oligosyltrehalose synthase [Dietzia maris]
MAAEDETGTGAGPSRGAALASTYRLQLRTPASDPDGRGFTLADAEELVPYLADLGVGAVYLSPVMTATPGSTHGYDVVDPTTVSAELGGIDALRSLRAACRAHELGLVVDIVPNHLGVDEPAANPWWWDSLRRGPDSPHFSFFDFDTEEANGADGRIAIPVLGTPDDVADLVVVAPGDSPSGEAELHFYDHRFPVAPGTGDGTAREVHDRQHYRLVHWREPLLGYRRFFTVTGLAGLRQEDPEVFEATHAEVRRWCEEDLVDAIRVDHPDGLADPVGYARRLRALAGDDRVLLVEKILAPGTESTPPEVLEPAMPVDGTTGYDALRFIDQLLVDASGEARLSELARRYTGDPGDEEQVHAQSAELKRQIVVEDLAPELARLARAVRREVAVGLDGPASDDVDEAALRETLISVVARTPFYRADYPVLRGTLPTILGGLRRDRPELVPALGLVAAALARGGEASTRLAQVTGAATAKAEEDRLFYRLARLVSLNEVGGSPGRMGMPVEAFHLAMAERARSTPLAMTALSTHDTKRGEDVRARISVLSQLPDEWADLVTRVFDEFPPPAEDAGYFLLQVIVGVWPELGGPTDDLRSRLHDYADKALREAAVHTTWTDQDADFESGVHRWIDTLIDSGGGLLGPFVERIAPAGRDNSLVAKAVQLLGPGIPDVYQGTEVWEDSLVDPDNRRFVDYGPLRSGAVARAGHPKFVLVRELLRLRRAHPEALTGGAYVPLPVQGPAASDVVAFTRSVDGRPAVGMIARRRTAVLPAEEFTGTVVLLPQGTWAVRPAGTPLSGRVDLGELLSESAVVVIVREGG